MAKVNDKKVAAKVKFPPAKGAVKPAAKMGMNKNKGKMC